MLVKEVLRSGPEFLEALLLLKSERTAEVLQYQKHIEVLEEGLVSLEVLIHLHLTGLLNQ